MTSSRLVLPIGRLFVVGAIVPACFALVDRLLLAQLAVDWKNIPLSAVSLGAFVAQGCADLVAAKGTTGSLNTDRLNSVNCHTHFGKQVMERFGNWAIIGRDVMVPLDENGPGLPATDVDLALTDNGRHQQLVPV